MLLFNEFLAELAAVICYGFLILALVLYWPNEANTYLLLFCLSNGILALVSAYKPKENNDLCRWNGLLSRFAPQNVFFILLVLIHLIFVSFTNYSFIGFDFGIWFPTSQPAWTETDGGTRVQVLSQTTAPLATVQKLYRLNCSLLYSVQPLQLQYYVSNVPNNVIIR